MQRFSIDLSTYSPDRSTVLVRCDFDVPYVSEKKIADDSRIVANVSTLKLLLSKHNRVICLAKHGKPSSPPGTKDSLRLASRYLQTLLPGELVEFIDTPITDLSREDLSKRSSLIVLENVRYYREEHDNNPSFARHISSFADWYVNDCFATSHRTEASIVGIPSFLPSLMGLHFYEEITLIDKLLIKPERPLVGILGGAKIDKKIQVVPFLLRTCDVVIVGGGIANTILGARGLSVGTSLVDQTSYPLARKILSSLKKSKGQLLIPMDFVVKTPAGKYVPRAADEIGRLDQIVDLGPITTSQITHLMAGAKSVLWNGPLGYIEGIGGQAASIELAKSIPEKAMTIMGGGETSSYLGEQNLVKPTWHMSTGGGALLSYVEHGTLPGIRALEESHKKYHTRYC